MAAITFPASPALNDIHTVGTRSWKFNGTAWKLVPKTTTDILEGTNLYYTDARVAAAPAVTALETRAGNIESAASTLAERVTTSEGNITTLTSGLATEKGRVDAILSASEADKDSFAEIVQLINSVNTGSSDAFAGYVTSNNAAVAAVEGRLDTAESDIDSLEGRAGALENRVTGVENDILGLGTMSSQDADSVAITGGTISGITLVASSLEVGSAGQTADLFVSEAGNVGIGTETPSERLSVAGNITATGTVSAAAPTASTHLTTKAYVDAVETSLQDDIDAVETSLQAEVTRATAAEQSLSDSIATLTSGLASSVLDAVLTGLSTATNAAISATDSVLVAFGKLQAQVSAVLSSLNTHVADTNNPHAVTKAQVGLGAADNTSDADKPVSTAQASAIATRQIADTLGTTAPAHENGRRWVDTADMSEYVSFNGAWIELDRA